MESGRNWGGRHDGYVHYGVEGELMFAFSLDIAEVALENGRRRYEEMRDRAVRGGRRLFQAHFIVADATMVRPFMLVLSFILQRHLGFLAPSSPEG